jgi:hypothetical protein
MKIKEISNEAVQHLQQKRVACALASKIDKSFASWVKMPAQNASPAPVVSTTCTLSESTLPLNFCIFIKEHNMSVLQPTLPGVTYIVASTIFY